MYYFNLILFDIVYIAIMVYISLKIMDISDSVEYGIQARSLKIVVKVFFTLITLSICILSMFIYFALLFALFL